jgi:hypothetical protein
MEPYLKFGARLHDVMLNIVNIRLADRISDIVKLAERYAGVLSSVCVRCCGCDVS